MELGILMFVTERSLAVTDLARACEERNLESLWVPEHPVVPVEHETRYPLSADGKLPRPYTELPDCFATPAAGRDRHLPRARAGPAPDGAPGGDGRLALGGPLPLRHRRRLAEGGDE